MTLLTIENLSLEIQKKEILKSVNLKIKRGEIFGLLGESGCGKSMTAAAITKLLPMHSNLTGKIFLDNENLVKTSETNMGSIRGKKISMIFQEPMTALNPLQTIGKQISESLLLHHNITKRDAMEIVINGLNEVGLDPLIISPNRYPYQLSGGQRQRVMIAMACILKPKLIIADEPTTALDVKTQAEILCLLKDLVEKENISLLLITHDLGVIAKLAHKVAIMKNGKLIDTGETKTVFTRLSHGYTRKILSDSIPKIVAPPKISQNVLLNVISISKTYKRKFSALEGKNFNTPTLRNISFSIRKGECLGLVGESGCGKSTLARSILGLESLDSGEINLDGAILSFVDKPTRDIRSKIQIVFQDPFSSFNPRHQIHRIISEPFNLLKKKHNKELKSKLLKEIISAVELEENDLKKYPHQFSGGQRQRIALARAIIIRPKLIILDEALSALDVSLRNNILVLLQKLSLKFNLSYLFISHDIHLIKAITNRVLIMRDGTLIEIGKTRKILKNPSHPYTKSLINATPSIPKSWIKRLGGKS
ncbi:MAG: microcin ABC transporter ATP-binding protein [Rhodobacteraceae bacterium]|nr:MAG: microcin ABC transporter ATP-binding protein [Paracoccaceae bacterium]